MARTTKMSIEWHRQCLVNQMASLMQQRDRVAREQAKLARDEAEFEFYSAQIEEAERRGLDGFDADKLMKSKTA